MSRSTRLILGAIVSVVVAVAVGFWLDRSTTEETVRDALSDAVNGVTEDAESPVEASEAEPGSRGTARVATRSLPEAAARVGATTASPQGALRARAQHLGLGDGVDPCEPLVEPSVPSGFESVATDGVTVAWPPAVDIAEPTLLAHVVAGMLAEAAAAMDADPRAHLVVLLYPSLDELRAATGAPKWAGGLYDGAVHVEVSPNRDFGVRIESLRHEVMHAAMHVAVGCTPAWLHEGAAMWFAGRPPVDGWTRWIREGVSVSFASLAVPTVADDGDGRDHDVELAYAESLAMVLYAKEHAVDQRLDAIVNVLREAPAEGARARAESLWTSLHPGVTEEDVRAWLARRVYGNDAPTALHHRLEPRLDHRLGAPEPRAPGASGFCCWGHRRIGTFACREATPPPGKTHWLDDAGAHAAICDVDGG